MPQTDLLLSSLFGRFARSIRSASRYDLVLAIIPAAFGAPGAAGAALPMDATKAVTAAAIVSVLAVVDALFLNPPRRPLSG